MDESCLWERVYVVHSSISETKPKECEMAFAQFGVSHSHTIFYFIFTVLLESFSLPGTFEWCKFITRTTFFELKRTRRTNELEYNRAGTERERERTKEHHAWQCAIQCDCGFLFAANKIHYSHILCVIFIECVWPPQLLSFNFVTEPEMSVLTQSVTK